MYGNDWEDRHRKILHRIRVLVLKVRDPQLKSDLRDLYLDLEDLKVDVDVAIDTMAQMGSRHSQYPGDYMGLSEDDYQDWLDEIEADDDDESTDES